VAAPQPIHVLIVDDDERFALAMTALLESDGFVVAGHARNGAEGVALAAQLRPTVATMDLGMPVMDGVEATRQIAALGITVVIVSGSDSSQRIGEAVAAGAVASLVKSDAVHSLALLLRAVVH
jgi:DNA-binding NarL/FixJ family response regulator